MAAGRRADGFGPGADALSRQPQDRRRRTATRTQLAGSEQTTCWRKVLTGCSCWWKSSRLNHPNAYGYSRCCQLYKAWANAKQNPTMLLEHKAGDKLFVDYAGPTLPITDPKTGEVTDAQIFVAALGASNYTFAEATLTQTLPRSGSWFAYPLHSNSSAAFPRLVVPETTRRSAVSSASRYEPDINPTYLKLAVHYGIAVVPARVRKPRDKSKVENAVLQVERNILARLREHTFHSLCRQVNAAIAELHSTLHNDRYSKSLGSSRMDLFLTIDRPGTQASSGACVHRWRVD